MSCNGLPKLARSLAGSVMQRKDIHTVNPYALDLDPELLCNCATLPRIISRSAKGVSGKRSRPAGDNSIRLDHYPDSTNHRDIAGLIRMD